MANPLIALGNLNRLRGAVIFDGFPELNITAPFLGKDGIKLSLPGDATAMLDQMAGVVLSQEVYLKATLTIALLKTTTLANVWKNKIERSTRLGDMTFRSDTAALQPYSFVNCAIEGIDGIDASGTNANMSLRISGTYYINSELWDL